MRRFEGSGRASLAVRTQNHGTAGPSDSRSRSRKDRAHADGARVLCSQRGQCEGLLLGMLGLGLLCCQHQGQGEGVGAWVRMYVTVVRVRVGVKVKIGVGVGVRV